MQRRKFIKSTALTTLAASATSSLAAQVSGAVETQQIYELRVYQLNWGGDVNRLGSYLEKALIPALNRQGVKNVGVFREMAAPEPPKLYVLIPYASMEQFGGIQAKLDEDKAYQGDKAEYDGTPVTALIYDRYHTSLLQAFSAMPTMAIPEGKARIFELRTYQGYSEDAVRRKVKMFNSEELPVFHKVGLHPVFFGHMLAGPDMPALVYMLHFEDMEERDKNWQAFSADEDWKRMSKLEEYANSVSRIFRVFLEPLPYSQV